MRSFLTYWRYQTLLNQLKPGQDHLMSHSASDQFTRVRVGDELWFVSIPPKSGQLVLFGHMIIDWVGGQREAARRLHTYPEELWESKAHVTASDDSAEPIDLVDITTFVSDLRFESGHDRLLLNASVVNPMSLQTMRLLTQESAVLLADVWYGEPTTPQVEEVAPANYVEGQRRMRSHFARERNPRLVADAKRAFIAQHGRLYCEICGFDFENQYGKFGKNFNRGSSSETSFRTCG